MKVVVQVVKNASVSVDNELVSKIDKGLLLFVGISNDDTFEIVDKMIKKIVNLRIFSDENGKTNLSVNDVNGEIMVVSQFTLYADCKKGNRPSFINAGAPDHANKLYKYMLDKIDKDYGIKPGHGIFGADMKVSLLNDGPFTIILDSKEIF